MSSMGRHPPASDGQPIQGRGQKAARPAAEVEQAQRLLGQEAGGVERADHRRQGGAGDRLFGRPRLEGGEPVGRAGTAGRGGGVVRDGVPGRERHGGQRSQRDSADPVPDTVRPDACRPADALRPRRPGGPLDGSGDGGCGGV
jgi:hypothetical protein